MRSKSRDAFCCEPRSSMGTWTINAISPVRTAFAVNATQVARIAAHGGT